MLDLLLQSQRALHETTETYRMLIDKMQEGVAVADPYGQFIFVNPRLAEITGYTIEDLIGKPFFQFVPPEELEAHHQAWQKGLEGEEFKFQTSICSKDGPPTPVLISGTPLHADTGDLRGVMAVITGLQDLQRVSERYQRLVEHLEEGIILENQEGIITFTNPRVSTMLGYSPDALLGQHWSKLIAFEELSKLRQESAQRPHGVRSRYETTLRTIDGKQIPVIVSANPMFTEGKFQGVLTVLTDITIQKEYQRLQDQFIASTGHELRTPVTVIAGYLDFLQRNPKLSQNEIDDIYQNMRGSVDRMTDLIENVHVLAQTRRDVFTLTPKPTSLEEIVHTLQNQCMILYPMRLFLLNFIQPQASPRDVVLDKNRILQAVHNLIDNAVKNSPPTSLIEISVIFTPNEVTFSIQDMGAGIPLLTFFQLFQPFTHIDTEYSARGTGLGLYIVKSIVLAHGGRVEVLSQEEHGSNFTIVIPTQVDDDM